MNEVSTPRPGRRIPTTPDPVEIAMEAMAEGGDESVARRLLENQNRLIQWQIAGERAGFALKVLTGLAGVAAAAALGLMVWQASQADGVILEPFTVPPALAADGVSGQVVANQVLDELARLRVETTTPGQARNYADDWGRSIKVSIPGSGISLGDLQDALRKWLGHEIRLTGEVYRTSAGLAVTARIPGRPGLKAEGPADQLPALSTSLARQIYRGTQPVRYAVWLDAHGDPAGARAVAQPIALTSPDRVERAAAFDIWALTLNHQGSPGGASAVARQGLAVAPESSKLWDTVAVTESNQSHWEASLAAYREATRRLPRDRTVTPGWRTTDVSRAQIATLTSDYAEALMQLAAIPNSPERLRNEAIQIDLRSAQSLSRLHDIAGARARLAAPRYALPWEALRNRYQLVSGAASVAWLAEDWSEARRASEEYLTLPARYFDPRHNPMRAILGVSLAMKGDADRARAILDDLAPDCDSCLLFRAQGLAALGDYGEADRLAATVARRAPSAPMGPCWRGRLRLQSGDAKGALPHFAEAVRRQPHWADPVEGQGEALAALGRWEEAEAAYAKAAPLAPKWGRTHLKWGQALARLGKTAEAQVQFRTAAGLYLTAAERAELARVIG